MSRHRVVERFDQMHTRKVRLFTPRQRTKFASGLGQPAARAGGRDLLAHGHVQYGPLANIEALAVAGAWTHGNMCVLGEDPEAAQNRILFSQVQYELLREKQIGLAEALAVREMARGSIPAQLASFRSPCDTCSPETLDMVIDFGLPAVPWNMVSGDLDRSQSAQAIAQAVPQAIVQDILRQAHPGAIVVMHANGRGWNTAEALRILVPALRDQGHRFGTVSELLALGAPVVAETCYEIRPGDNDRYDRMFGKGTGD